MKSNLKKLCAIALAAAMAAGSLASCGNGSGGSSESTSTASEPASTASETGTTEDAPLVVAYNTFNQRLFTNRLHVVILSEKKESVKGFSFPQGVFLRDLV